MAAPLVRWLKRSYVFLLICPLCVPAFLNLEELNEMKYGIQILPDPVIMGQVSEAVFGGKLTVSLLARKWATVIS